MKNLWCLLLLDDSLVMERKREITHIHTYTEKEVEGGGRRRQKENIIATVASN